MDDEDEAICAAVVTATVEENAVLWGANGKKADSYGNEYKCEYELVLMLSDRWQIRKVLVVGS